LRIPNKFYVLTEKKSPVGRLQDNQRRKTKENDHNEPSRKAPGESSWARAWGTARWTNKKC